MHSGRPMGPTDAEPCGDGGAFAHVWAPWRMEYVVGSKPAHCVFCEKTEQGNDERSHILYRAMHCYVVVNAYPYNSGHVMVVPYRHVSHLGDLDRAELAEMFLLAQGCARVFSDALHAQGINIGMNIGQAAGAGIEDHLHLHLVPRWSGDTNYITTVAGVRVVPQDPDETFAFLMPVLRKALDELTGADQGGVDSDRA